MEQPRREALRPLRPLPSIDIPLLREERSAMRNRRLVRLALCGALLGVVGGGVALAGSTSREQTGSEDAQPAPAGPRPPEALAVAAGAVRTPETGPPRGAPQGPAPRLPGRHERSFGKALSFYDGLVKAGLASDEANAVIAALSGKLDFRRARAEDLLITERAADASLSRFEYRAGPTLRFEAVRSGSDSYDGRQIELPVEVVRVARGGMVEGSLGDALEGLKLGRALTGVFTDVLAGKVSFSTDTRTGDSFRVLLEEERVEGSFLRYGTIHALEYRGEKVGLVRAFWHESAELEGDFYDETGRALQGGWLRTPLRYDHVSSGFGMRFHPVLRRKQLHNGIDYAAGTGTPVRAAAAGTVRIAGPRGPSGNLVSIRHARGYESFYAHLARIAPGVRPGARVKQREVIAYVGSTGRSTGPHLHFALKRGGRFVDPGKQLNGPGLPLPARELAVFKQRAAELSAALDAIPLERPAKVAPPPEPAPLDFGEDEL